MESIPFAHANQMFTITFEDDLSFTQVRAILDHLIAQNAFDHEVQAERGLYEIEVDEGSFKVWVTEMEVIVQKRFN
jgi:hypothetical protein